MGYRIRSLPIETIKNTSNFCIYCGKNLQEWEKVIDHFISCSSGGPNTKSNLFISCRECNSVKSDKHFEDLESAREFILPIVRNKGIKREIVLQVTEYDEDIILKKCNKCEILKPITQFGYSKCTLDFKCRYCKECSSILSKKYASYKNKLTNLQA